MEEQERFTCCGVSPRNTEASAFLPWGALRRGKSPNTYQQFQSRKGKIFHMITEQRNKENQPACSLQRGLLTPRKIWACGTTPAMPALELCSDRDLVSAGKPAAAAVGPTLFAALDAAVEAAAMSSIACVYFSRNQSDSVPKTPSSKNSEEKKSRDENANLFGRNSIVDIDGSIVEDGERRWWRHPRRRYPR